MKRSAKGRVVLLSHLCTNAPMVFQARMCFLDTITIRSICFIDRDSLIHCSRSLNESQSHSSAKANTPRETTRSRYHSIRIYGYACTEQENYGIQLIGENYRLGIFDPVQYLHLRYFFRDEKKNNSFCNFISNVVV